MSWACQKGSIGAVKGTALKQAPTRYKKGKIALPDPNAEAPRLHSPGSIRFFDRTDRETGVVRRIFLFVPPGPAPEKGWPWLVLLDGNAVIATGADILRSQAFYPMGTNLGWGVLIGVGYPTDEPYDPLQRSWDLSPAPGREYPAFYPDSPVVRTGGAAELARFILEDMVPELASELLLDRENGSLYGHSFGGLFVLWLMFTRPQAFRNWIAVSPSITWEDNNLLRFLPGFDPAAVTGYVHLSAGEWEGDRLAPFQMAGPEREKRLKDAAEEQTIAAAERLVTELSPALGPRLSFEIFADTTHMSVLPAALNRALHVAFDLWRGDQASG